MKESDETAKRKTGTISIQMDTNSSRVYASIVAQPFGNAPPIQPSKA